jgi:dolichyl-phosphate-mannose-protein mannosyltransferase
MTKEQRTDNFILITLAICGILIHILLNGQYGFHRDELDVIMNARQLDWGYVAYPPFTPFLARLSLELFGDSLRGMRAFPAIAQGIAMILAGLMARAMGGKRNAQILSAFSMFIAPISLVGGTWIMYFAFDYLWWVVTAFFLVLLLATDEPRYWLGVGAGIGFGMMTKFTMAFWVIALVVAVLITPARKYLRSKWLYLGAALALILYLPNLIWQIQHNFISLDFLSSIHARDIEWGRADDFLIEQLYGTTNPFSLPLWIVGLSLCLFGSSMKRFRTLGWMFIVTFLLFLVNRGRTYYVAPAVRSRQVVEAEILPCLDLNATQKNILLETIELHDYRDMRPTQSDEALLLREADMLEFLGMIGMARDFARGPRNVEVCYKRILSRRDDIQGRFTLPYTKEIAHLRIKRMEKSLQWLNEESFGVL